MPQLCLSRLQMVLMHKRKKHFATLFNLCVLCSCGVPCERSTAWRKHIRLLLLYEFQHNVNTTYSSFVSVFISVATCGPELGHYVWTHLCWLLHTCLLSYLLCIYILTLFGCTALLRFSIHLSLSADERQEKHLLPVEVVTYRVDTERRKTNAFMIKTLCITISGAGVLLNLVHKYTTLSLMAKEAYEHTHTHVETDCYKWTEKDDWQPGSI